MFVWRANHQRYLLDNDEALAIGRIYARSVKEEPPFVDANGVNYVVGQYKSQLNG